MEMDLLLKRVGKELETIADKGIPHLIQIQLIN